MMRSALLTSFVALHVTWSASAADFAEFAEKHCISCHDADIKKGGLDFASLKQEMVIAAGTALSNLKEKLGLVCEHSVVEGPIAEAIHDEAVRRHADLIVTGRGHAQGSFSRLWSHLYPIIRQAPCPVLSV